MKTSWLKGLTPQEKIECKSEFAASARIRERLRTLLEAKADEARKKSRATVTYENPNWALLQADLIGYEKALFEVISLISEESVTKP